MKKICFCLFFLFSFLCFSPFAEGKTLPSVNFYGYTFTVENGIDKDILDKMVAVSKEIKDYGKVEFMLNEISNKDFKIICTNIPKIERLSITNCLTDFSPIAKLKNLKAIKCINVQAQNFSPFNSLIKLESLEIDVPNLEPDLLWMRDMKKIKYLSIRAENLKSLIGLPQLSELQEATFGNCKLDDLSLIPLSLPQLKKLSLINCTVKDLTPLSKLKKLSKLNLYGSVIKDFSSLAGCSSLKDISVYSTKEADYQTLEKLKSLERVKCGLTAMKNLSWVTSLPHLKELDLFSEEIKDFSPLWHSNIEKLTIWNRDTKIETLSVISKISSLQELLLINFENAKDSASLSSLNLLKKLSIFSYNKKQGEYFDLTAAIGWKNIEEIEIADTAIVNENHLTACSKLKKVSFSGVTADKEKQISLRFLDKSHELETLTLKECNAKDFEYLSHCTSLKYLTMEKITVFPSWEVIRDLPKLKRLNISKGVFSEEQIKELSKKIKISLR